MGFYVNHIERDDWSGPDLLEVIGPFATAAESETFARRFNKRNNLPSAPAYYTVMDCVGQVLNTRRELMSPLEFWEDEYERLKDWPTMASMLGESYITEMKGWIEELGGSVETVDPSIRAENV